jgi:hypothetical protein
MEDLAMLATKEDNATLVNRETVDGTVKAAEEWTGKMTNPLTLLVKGIKTKESKTDLGLEIYFETPTVVEGPRAFPHTKEDMVIPKQAFISKSARIYADRDYDNAGENKALEKECQAQGLGIQFEYTAPGTPQHNGRVELKFATLYGRVRSMLNEANLGQTRRTGIWTKAARTATLLDTVLVSASKQEASYSACHLKIFGKVGVVLNHAEKAIKGKPKD